MPRRSLTWSRTRSISRSTSLAGAVGLGDDEVGMAVADHGPADSRSFEPCPLDQFACTDAARVLEHAARALMSHGLAGLADDPLLLQALGQLLGIVGLQLNAGLEDRQLVEAAFAIAENQFVAAAGEDFAGVRDDGGLDRPLADVAAVGAGIGVQRAAERAGNGDQGFQPGQAAVRGSGHHAAELGAAAGGDGLPIDLDLGERRLAQPDYHARYTLFLHQQVRAASQDADGEALLAAALDQGDQLVGVLGLSEVFGRAAQLEPRVHCQQLALPDDFLKTGQDPHGDSCVLQTKPQPWPKRLRPPPPSCP